MRQHAVYTAATRWLTWQQCELAAIGWHSQTLPEMGPVTGQLSVPAALTSAACCCDSSIRLPAAQLPMRLLWGTRQGATCSAAVPAARQHRDCEDCRTVRLVRAFMGQAGWNR